MLLSRAELNGRLRRADAARLKLRKATRELTALGERLLQSRRRDRPATSRALDGDDSEVQQRGNTPGPD